MVLAVARRREKDKAKYSIGSSIFKILPSFVQATVIFCWIFRGNAKGRVKYKGAIGDEMAFFCKRKDSGSLQCPISRGFRCLSAG